MLLGVASRWLSLGRSPLNFLFRGSHSYVFVLVIHDVIFFRKLERESFVFGSGTIVQHLTRYFLFQHGLEVVAAGQQTVDLLSGCLHVCPDFNSVKCRPHANASDTLIRLLLDDKTCLALKPRFFSSCTNHQFVTSVLVVLLSAPSTSFSPALPSFFFFWCGKQVDIPASQPGAFFSGFNDTILRTDGDPQSPLPSSTSTPGSAGASHQFHRITFTSEGASVSPYVLPGLAMDSRVEAVSVGWKHTVALVR